MKRKVFNVVQLLLFVISFFILCIPTLELINTSPNKISVIQLASKYDITFIPMIVLFILCVFMNLISIILKKENRDGKIHCILPIFLFVITNYDIMTSCSSDEILKNNFPVVLFEICLFLTIVLGFAKRSEIVSGIPKVEVKNNNCEKNYISNADELKKYKDLLDSGIITQDEFNTKKKQLLE